MVVKLPAFDRYYHYLESVQSPEEDVRFMAQVARESRGAKTKLKVFREDFCGTFTNCCEWVKLGPDYVAHGVDLDPEPIAYGKANYMTKLTPSQQARITLHKTNVMGAKVPKADVICALNFSYCIFKERKQLVAYFKNCLKTLSPKGVLILDSFGGSASQDPNEEQATFGDPPFTYYWDQDSFDPLTYETLFKIHFKRPGEAKRLDVFTYDWRLWTVPELRDALLDAGFKTVNLYWEGATPDGSGDGDFRIVKHGEPCEGWIAYLAALK